MKKILWITVILLLVALIIYLILWLISRRSYPVAFGITFSPRHAEWLGLNAKETYRAMLTDLKPKYIRLSARWDEIEAPKGQYNFGELDYLMNEAARRGTKVLLVVGEKLPRWPECYAPSWAREQDEAGFKTDFFAYIKKTVQRYRDHNALELWQVENEPFIQFPFGECVGYDGSSVSQEVRLVHDLDHEHQVVVTDSGELSLWYKASHAGDIFGTTVYRVVRSRGFYFTYDWLLPAVYSVKSWLWRIPYERFFVSELQAEPWLPDGDLRHAATTEQEKSLNPERLRSNLDYVTHVGASRSYLWGVEWWYYMKTIRNDPRYWEIVKERLNEEKVVEKKLEIRN